jgi:hypothetical protein
VLHRKHWQFLIASDTDDAGIYEIVSYCRLKDKSLCYDVQFNDCDDTITLDEEELWNMLVYSLYILA